MTERERIEQQILKVLENESEAIPLSNKLFSPGGLFSRLASIEKAPRALVQSPLFRESHHRFRTLQRAEAEEFVRSVQEAREARSAEPGPSRSPYPDGAERETASAAGRGGPERRPLSDTNPEAEKIMIELYRRMPAWQKLQQVCDLNRTVELLALGDIRRRHPDADERELRLRLASRWLSPETMRTVFGWDIEVEGY